MILLGERTRWIRCLFTGILLLMTLYFLVMAFLGLFYYTSIGVDIEEDRGDRVRCTYLRLRWPGNGSFWLGGGEHMRPLRLRPLCPFDLASSAYRKPSHLPEPETFWNRLGFWWFVNPECDPCNKRGYPKLTWGYWVGVPAWLPAVLTGIWSWRRCRVRKENASRFSEPIRCIHDVPSVSLFTNQAQKNHSKNESESKGILQ